MKSSFSLDLKLKAPRSRLAERREIRILEAAGGQSPQAIRAARKLVAASRQNVRFLNRHLKSYRPWLKLPALVDNVLYLAYTITVKDAAPFRASELRQALDQKGIETSSEFDFSPDKAGGRGFDPKPLEILTNDEHTFCLACHQYLTIRDLEYIIGVFESFFAGIRSPHPYNEGYKGRG
jgi:dTDP-4-amino-4,6-dideoxygalactose transaminase